MQSASPLDLRQTSVRTVRQFWALATLLAVGVSSLPAQVPVYVPIPVGTRVPVITLSEISSKSAKKGTKLSLEVTENVVVDGHTVIQKGAPIWGVVAEVKKAGRFDSDGSLVVNIDSVKTVDGKSVALMVNLHDAIPDDDNEKKNSQLGANASKAVKSLPGGELATGFFKRGDDIVIDANTPIYALTASYVALQLIDSNPPAAVTSSDSSGSAPNEQAILLIDGIETWGQALGALAATLGSTPQIRSFGAKMAKAHAELRARGIAFAKSHNVDVSPLPPADQTALNDALKTLRSSKSEDFDKAVLDRIQGLAQNVINVFEEGGAPGLDDLIAEAVKTWTVNAGDAMNLSGQGKGKKR